MTATEGPRTVEYLVLRVCERLGMSEEAFWSAEYGSQVRWLAYEVLREREEAVGAGAG